MSLKAKVEAVVYAAEEPVTLAQLAGIFSKEVLDALAAAADRAAEAGVAAADEQEPSEAATTALWADEPSAEAEPAAGAAVEPAATDAADTRAAAPADPASAPAGAAAAQLDAKKEERRRDRQVREELERILQELIAEYATDERGMEIREVAGGYRMATKPEYHDAVRGFVKSLKPPMKLSLQALETLAVIAYKQPVTAPEVSEIRGVDSGGVLGSLIGRKLISTAGRKQVIGRPILYRTSKEFLLRFGLKDLNDLPSMEEFEKMAGELAEAETQAEDAAMRASDQLPLEEQPATAEAPSGGIEGSEDGLDGQAAEAEAASQAEPEAGAGSPEQPGGSDLEERAAASQGNAEGAPQ